MRVGDTLTKMGKYEQIIEVRMKINIWISYLECWYARISGAVNARQYKVLSDAIVVVASSHSPVARVCVCVCVICMEQGSSHPM